MNLILQLLDVLSFVLLQPAIIPRVLGTKRFESLSAIFDRFSGMIAKFSGMSIAALRFRRISRDEAPISRMGFYRNLELAGHLIYLYKEERDAVDLEDFISGFWKLLHANAAESEELAALAADEEYRQVMNKYFELQLTKQTVWSLGEAAYEGLGIRSWVTALWKYLVMALLLCCWLGLSVWVVLPNRSWMILASSVILLVVFGILRESSDKLFRNQAFAAMSANVASVYEAPKAAIQMRVPILGWRVDLLYLHYWFRAYTRLLGKLAYVATLLICLLTMNNLVQLPPGLGVLSLAFQGIFAGAFLFAVPAAALMLLVLAAGTFVKWIDHLRARKTLQRVLLIVGVTGFLLARALSLVD